MKPLGSQRQASAAFCVGATLLLVGCGEGTTTGTPTGEPEGTKVWFTAGEQFEPVDTDSPDAGPKTAVRELLEGPARRQRAAGEVPVETQIPEGASLEELDVDDDGTAVVKVSPEFAGGVPAEPGERSRDQEADLDARVAQVTYTLTQFEGVEGGAAGRGRHRGRAKGRSPRAGGAEAGAEAGGQGRRAEAARDPRGPEEAREALLPAQARDRRRRRATGPSRR